MGKGTEQKLLHRGHTNGQHIYEKILTSLIIGEMQIKTTVRYNLTPVRMAVISQSTNNKSWQGCGQRETLMHHW